MRRSRSSRRRGNFRRRADVRFTGTHRTTYTYSDEIFLQPHKIRPHPRCDTGQNLRDYAIRITPEPDGMTEALDACGTNMTCSWFSGNTSKLVILTYFFVDRLR